MPQICRVASVDEVARVRLCRLCGLCQGCGVLRTDELDFELPEELIATTPAEPRDAARMLVISRGDANVLEHRHVRDLARHLRAGDLIVVNNTRVIPARFEGRRKETGGRLPGLYLGPSAGRSDLRRWLVYLKGGHLHPGVRVVLGEGVELELIERSNDEPGAWVGAVHGPDVLGSDQAILERVGKTPLPPYILAARKARGLELSDAFDRDHYQTTYAVENATAGGGPGSVAAPTAGLHFTAALLDELRLQGIERAEVTLHVGSGTFKPIETEFVEQHPIHAERCSMPPRTAEAIRRTRQSGGRVFAIGTTAARAIESYASLAETGQPLPETLDTRIFITPGYQWRWVDGMLTNFHLPRSTLLAMVSSLLAAPTSSTAGSGSSAAAGGEVGGTGLARLKETYRVAVGERYRFFSYGDAMLVLP